MNDFNSRIHWRFGLLLWLFLLMGGIVSNPLGALLGSLLPDSDHKGTVIGKILPLWVVFGHRTWTHTWWGLLGFSGLFWGIFGFKFGLGFFIGYFSHLLLDSCTKAGVRWFRLTR